MNLRFVIVLFFFSCASIQPRSEDAIGGIQSVYDEDDEKRGDLFLQQDGLWAYTGDGLVEGIGVGGILHYGGDNVEDAHTFAVVEVNIWGLILQRLDSDPLKSNQSDGFHLSDFSEKDLEKWSTCLTQDCMQGYQPNIIFHIFKRADEGSKTIQISQENQQFPFQRVAIARISNRSIIVEGTLPAAYFAIASNTEDYPTLGRIADQGCFAGADKSRISAPFPTQTSAFDISKNAARLSVDGFLSCKEGQTKIAIPGLWRAYHPEVFGSFDIPPIISSQTYQIPQPSKEGLEQLSQFIIGVGTGDFAAADFWLDQFSKHHSSKAYRVFLKNAAEISTAANRPENAMRQLRIATRGYWNPENDARWNTVQYRIAQQLNTPREAIVRYAKLPEFFEKEEDPILDFLTFFALRDKRHKNVESEKAAYLNDKKKWKSASQVDAMLEKEDQGEGKDLSAFNEDARSLLKTFTSIVDNPLDVFGRHLNLDKNEALWQRGKSQYNKTYALSAFLSNADISKYAYFFKNLKTNAKSQLLSQFIAKGVDSQDCQDPYSTLGPELVMRLDAEEDQNRLLLWYLFEGVREKCRSDIAFINAAKKASQDLATIGPSVMMSVLSRKNITTESIEKISDFALNFSKGPLCVRYHLGLSFALLKKNTYIASQKYLRRASRCSEEKNRDQKILEAFSIYERTGQIEGLPEIEHALKKTTHSEKSTCPAHLPLAFNYNALVSIQTQKDSERFSVKAAVIPFDSSSRAIQDGLKKMNQVYSLLKSHRFEKAVEELKNAREIFESTRFLPGLHRVNFLQKELIEEIPPKKNAKEGKITFKPTPRSNEIMDGLFDAEKASLPPNETLKLILLGLPLEKSMTPPELCDPILLPKAKLVIE